MDTVKVVNTPYNNAVALLNRTNELLNENNIMDSTGTEIAQLEQNVANPAWLFALACGNLHTSWQEKIAKAYACLDPQNCEDDQVLVLASLAGLTRGNGTPTHVTAKITNNGDSAVTVPIGTEFTETFANQTWVMNKKVTIEAGAYQYVTLFTTSDGEFNIPSELAFNYDGDLDISCESSSESAGGSNIETLASLRNRISQGQDTSDPVIQCKTAIELLSGIENCNIWFNHSQTEDLSVGTISIPPRNCYLSIKGYDYSGKIAEIYFTYLNVPATVGAQEEEHLLGQEEVSVKFDYATETTIEISVKVQKSSMASGYEGAIKNAIVSHSGTLGCGENVTSQMLSEWVENLGYGNILGCCVKAGTSDAVSSNINPNEYCIFTPDKIEIKEM